MYCKQCGKEITEGTICDECAKKVNADQAGNENNKPDKRLEAVRKIFGSNELLIAGILLVLSYVASLIDFPINGALHLNWLVFGILIIIYNQQTKKDDFFLKGADTLKAISISATVFAGLCLAAIVLIVLILIFGNSIIYKLYDYFVEVTGFAEIVESLVIEEGLDINVMPLGFMTIQIIIVVVGITISVAFLVDALIMFTISKVSNRIRRDFMFRQELTIFPLGINVVLYIFGTLNIISGLGNLTDDPAEFITSFCSGISYFLIAFTLSKYNEKRIQIIKDRF